MSKITRPRLARGTKLVREHIQDPLNQLATKLSVAGLDELAQSWGIARINLHVPILDSDYWKHALDAGQKVDFCIPFCLPPLQEFWSLTGNTNTNTPELVLDEFSISFDQRSEPAALADFWAGVGEHGNLNYESVGQLNLDIALVEKSQWFFNNSQPNEPEREVISVTLNSVAYSGRTLRFNPFLKTGLSKTLNPYKTYMLMITCPDLYGVGILKSVGLPSLLVSLKIRHPLVERDKGPSIQNMPTIHAGGQVGQSIVVPNPLANDQIQATGDNGVQSSLERFDLPLLQGLQGGYERDANAPPVEAIITDAAYEIIAVPMWGNLGIQYGVRAEDVFNLPYQTTSPATDLTIDRRIIPIDFPMTIHHVIACASQVWPYDGTGTGHRSASVTYTNYVGVGIGTGLRGDYFNYEQVAYKAWTPGSILATTVDHVKSRAGGTLTSDGWDFDLLSIPIVGINGKGYYTQGMPFFVGKGSTITTARTNVNDLATAPLTKGCEQWLEVRWAFQDPAGLGHTAPPGAGPWLAGQDLWAAATNINGTAGTAAVTDTTGFTKEPGEPNHGGGLGGASAWWLYLAPQSGFLMVDTTGSTGVGGPPPPPHILLGIYTGAAVNALTPVAGTGNQDPGVGGVATWTFPVTGGSAYYIATDSFMGTAQLVTLNWYLDAGAAADPYVTYIGRGGHWVMIYGKKHLCED